MFTETTNSWHAGFPYVRVPKPHWGYYIDLSLNPWVSQVPKFSCLLFCFPMQRITANMMDFKNRLKSKGVSRSLDVKCSVEELRHGLNQLPHLALSNQHERLKSKCFLKVTEQQQNLTNLAPRNCCLWTLQAPESRTMH